MSAGPKRCRLKVDEPVDTQDDTGAITTGFVDRTEVWGSIEPLTGRESLQANAITGVMDTRIVIRWSPKVDVVTPKWRLRDAETGTVYNVVSVAHLKMARKDIEIMASTGLNAG